jgi:hypothetical protein
MRKSAQTCDMPLMPLFQIADSFKLYGFAIFKQIKRCTCHFANSFMSQVQLLIRLQLFGIGPESDQLTN